MITLPFGYGIANPLDVRDARAMQNTYHEMMLQQAHAMQNMPSIYEAFGLLGLANHYREPEAPAGWQDWYAIGDQLH